ncbi:N-acetylgalactosamine-specific PTS system transporter subunit IIB [Lactobacillus plantarum JDM1] [Lactiplantibacillus mudanjiangensis]|uniref:PTS galactosamine transporter subunit IIB n=1 Tax=Lactiplantibacillus mudanjiangensis TaxID=1296538 RepID=UPI0010157C8A|nr:PTS galactosamine transporter subunit IIB [Lactiplantibacillus mudanjiangensis]VDG20840.1 N-acetylgalactosamine-specific PTS system transporter subunit IIB [Lactobacillus plantarum JDM1] [Lactiplantibacillus mudanjiangensis]VDG32031.1 N-acetylgalactosamine-specific PTS system transporter subunit IIB [Lactobacillus plantarum JDM1] [Lactiplantibacillus mudanjiangensis]
MGEPNIVLTRIDNRLVHGQVGVVWTSSAGANLLLVANDETANDQLQQELMAATAETSGVGIRFWTIDKTVSTISKASARQKIFLIVRNPQDARRLVEGGVPIKDLNIGNMHFSQGKTQVTKYTYMDDQDKADLKACADAGVNVYVQEVPEDKKQPLEEVI